MVKMKVTTQGEEVINLLWDVIAARGFEEDRYFEMAVKDIRSLSKPDSTAKQMDLCLRMIKRPVVDTERFQRFWERRVYALKDAYVMNP